MEHPSNRGDASSLQGSDTVKVHVKKCWPCEFAAVRTGEKPFEWRKEDDCTYSVGDLLVLLEFAPENEQEWWPYPTDVPPPGYTGEVEKRRVTYVLRDQFGVPEGYAVLGLGKP